MNATGERVRSEGGLKMVIHPPGAYNTGAATLVEQCRQIKAVDPTTKCFVYRNTELVRIAAKGLRSTWLPMFFLYPFKMDATPNLALLYPSPGAAMAGAAACSHV